MNKLENIRVDFHRNGISGEGFYVALFNWFDDVENKNRNMMAVLFNSRGQCAIFDVDELALGNIQFAQGNSWRGDHYEPELRAAIKKASTSRVGPFAIPLAKHDLQIK